MSLDDLDLIESRKAERRSATGGDLRKSKALFEAAESLARMGHWEWNDAEDRCSYCSKELARLHGLTVEQYLACMGSTDAALETVHPDDRRRVEQHWSDSRERRARSETEYRIIRADGDIVHVREVEDRVLNDEGQLVRSVGFVQDITDRKRVEADLRASETRFRGLFDFGLVGTAVLTPAGHFAEVNQAYCDLLGYRPDELVGHHFARVIHPDDLAGVTARLAALLGGSSAPYHHQRRYRHKLGHEVWGLAGLFALRDLDGTADRFVVQVVDISDRKRAEDALRDSERRFRDFAQAASDWFWETGPDLKLRWYSKSDHPLAETRPSAFEQGGGSAAEPLIGKAHWDIASEPVEDQKWRGFRADLAAHRPIRDFRYRVASRGDEIGHRGISAVPAFDADGRFQGYRGTASDITSLVEAEAALRQAHGDLEVRIKARTADLRDANKALRAEIAERKRTEEAVRTSDAWLRAILVNSPIQIAIKDTAGRIMAISRNVEEETGVAASDFIGRRVSDFLPAPIADIYEAADRMVVATGRAKQQEVVEALNGATRHLLNAKFPLRDDAGEIIGICSLTSDITAEKLGEERLRRAQKMEAVGQLTGGVAHDFNNLLAVIQGNAEFLQQVVPEGDQSVADVLRATRRGAELTQHLLAFSRQQPLRPRSVDLAELVSGMAGLLARTLGETIEVGTAIGPDLWPALADPGQVENALLNLAINARDAMPNGGRLTIECANAQLDQASVIDNPEALAGDYVVLAVSDNGSGMSPEVLDHALEPFFTTKDVGEGSGLGLSMVYGFTRQSGGHVVLNSEPGQGTTVKLYLPRDLARAAPVDYRPVASSPRGRGELILVIEDNEGVRKVAVKMLEALGYRVIDVPEVASAQAIFDRGEKIDLVLSDVVLPGGASGPDFADRLQRTNPALRVVFMSGYLAEAVTRDGLLEPGTVLLTKPFERQQLAQALRRALGTGN